MEISKSVTKRGTTEILVYVCSLRGVFSLLSNFQYSGTKNLHLSYNRSSMMSIAQKRLQLDVASWCENVHAGGACNTSVVVAMCDEWNMMC